MAARLRITLDPELKHIYDTYKTNLSLTLDFLCLQSTRPQLQPEGLSLVAFQSTGPSVAQSLSSLRDHIHTLWISERSGSRHSTSNYKTDLHYVSLTRCWSGLSPACIFVALTFLHCDPRGKTKGQTPVHGMRPAASVPDGMVVGTLGLCGGSNFGHGFHPAQGCSQVLAWER